MADFASPVALGLEELQLRSKSLHQEVEAASRAVFEHKTPARALRTQEEAVLLTHDVINHAELSRLFPYVYSQRASLLGPSTVVLTDGSGEFAVLAVHYVAQARGGQDAAAQAKQLEGARWVAEHQAHKFVEDELLYAGGGHVAVGVVSNVAGLSWVLPPQGMPAPTTAAGGSTAEPASHCKVAGSSRLPRCAVAVLAICAAAAAAAAVVAGSDWGHITAAVGSY